MATISEEERDIMNASVAKIILNGIAEELKSIEGAFTRGTHVLLWEDAGVILNSRGVPTTSFLDPLLVGPEEERMGPYRATEWKVAKEVVSERLSEVQSVARVRATR